MSEDQLRAFLVAISSEQSLQEALKLAATPSEVVKIAQQFGFAVEIDGLQSLQSELSDAEFEGISGGVTITPAASPATPYILGAIFGAGAVAATIELCSPSDSE
jgi:predicted ribosomally synthesized peptide with nif11-like leader